MHAPEFWQRDGFFARALNPVGHLFGLIGQARRRLAKAEHVAIPVICVGNLTAGGAGKTPTAIAVAEHLQAGGMLPHVLTRGYGGRARGPLKVDSAQHDSQEVGDEALLLAEIAPTWVSRDRVAGARAAKAAGASHVILDDGLQNPHLVYDLTLLVVDGAVGFGNRRLIPAGPLRESVENGLRRIDAVVRIGSDSAGIDRSLPPSLPILEADLEPTGDVIALAGRRLIAFAGIGRPEKFFAMLRACGAEVLKTHPFPDHHPYQPSEIDRILAEARQFDACCVTTAKDHVRLPLTLRNSVEKIAVKLRFHRPDLLARLLPDHAGSPDCDTN